MQLSPREYFTIARGLEDHTDNTVFYVRAAIRNARTDALIDTINLTNQGDNHRYSLPWQVPADTSGQGFYILVTTSVYTDSGYTTKSSIYGDKFDTYLVMERANPNQGIGGGDSVDYKKIQKMVKEAVAEIPKPEKAKEVVLPDFSLQPVISAIDAVRVRLDTLKFPEQKPVDLSGVMAKLEEVLSVASDKDMTDEQIGPLHDMHDKMASMLEANSNESLRSQLEETMMKTQDVLVKIKEFFGKDMDAVMAGIEEIKKEFGDIQCVVLSKKNETKS